MKHIYILLSFLLVLHISIITQTQSGWFWVNPKPQGNNLSTLKFSSTNVVYAAGDMGSILKSTNGGSNWTCIYNNYLLNFTSLCFVNDNYGFVAGGYNPLHSYSDTNFIIKTANGGLNWDILNTGVLGKIDGVYFSDVNTGYLNVNTTGIPPGKILKTANGGINWTQLNHGANGYIRSMNFLNANTGFALYDSGFIKTSNGGINWIQNHIDTANMFPVMLFTDENTGFIAGSYLGVRKTTNGGLNWTISGGNNWSNSIASLSFINAFTGYAVGGYNGATGAIYATTNSGLNWTLQLSGFPGYLRSINFNNANTWVTTGDFGHLYATSNGGVNWIDRSEGIRNDLCNLYFINANTGFAAGYWGVVIKTTDGGGNWISKNFDTITVPCALQFTNAQTGFVGGADGNNYARLYRTSNGGNNWYQMLNQQFKSCNSIYFMDNFTGYCTWNTDIYKTLNSGINWYSKYPEGTLVLNSVCFSGPDIGYAVGSQGIFIKSTNAGENWITMPSWTSTSISLSKVTFKDVNTGYVTGWNVWTYASYLYKTTNGGINWTTIIPWPGVNNYSSMSFINVNTGYLLGAWLILKTTNGGINWFSQHPRSYNAVSDIFALNDTLAYACGENGTIIKTTDGGGYFSKVERKSYAIPEKYTLLQNYPNPFNPSTRIEFEIRPPLSPLFGKEGTGVVLKIYDLLGREVTTLVNEQLKPGTYEVQWDATNYPSGVYFYKLTAGAFSESKRMVLVK